jgi:hypothetical protein
MSAGSSPTGGIGGLFYALLLFTGIILNRDTNVLKNNARIILPIILVLSFCIVLVLNIIVIGKYVNFSIGK